MILSIFSVIPYAYESIFVQYFELLRIEVYEKYIANLFFQSIISSNDFKDSYCECHFQGNSITPEIEHV